MVAPAMNQPVHVTVQMATVGKPVEVSIILYYTLYYTVCIFYIYYV